MRKFETHNKIQIKMKNKYQFAQKVIKNVDKRLFFILFDCLYCGNKDQSSRNDNGYNQWTVNLFGSY